MSLRAMRVCTNPGCRTYTREADGRCDKHKRKRDPKTSTDPFYLTKAWRAVRAQHITQYPLCADCEDKGRVVPAVIVDHVLERRDRPDLELDTSNLRSLCFRCHSAKTAREQWRRRKAGN